MKKLLIMFLAAAFGLSLTAGTLKHAKKDSPLPVKKERATLKHFNENDPSTAADNTITIAKEGKEAEVPIHKNWDKARVSPFHARDVNLTYVYEPETGDYTVTNIEPFMN